MKRKYNLLAVIMMVCTLVVFVGTTETYAWNSKKTRNAYSSYYGESMGQLDARIWISTLKTNYSHTKVTFDAISSSWVNNATKKITKHVNTLKVKKTGLTGSLSVSASKSASLSLAEMTDNVCELSTQPANSYYRGINSYNNCITRGVGGTILSFTTPLLAYLVVTGTSSQSVYLDGQAFYNSATTSAYF